MPVASPPRSVLSALPSHSSDSAESRCSSSSPGERPMVSTHASKALPQLSALSATTLSDCTVWSLKRPVAMTSLRWPVMYSWDLTWLTPTTAQPLRHSAIARTTHRAIQVLDPAVMTRNATRSGGGRILTSGALPCAFGHCTLATGVDRRRGVDDRHGTKNRQGSPGCAGGPGHRAFRCLGRAGIVVSVAGWHGDACSHQCPLGAGHSRAAVAGRDPAKLVAAAWLLRGLCVAAGLVGDDQAFQRPHLVR